MIVKKAAVMLEADDSIQNLTRLHFSYVHQTASVSGSSSGTWCVMIIFVFILIFLFLLLSLKSSCMSDEVFNFVLKLFTPPDLVFTISYVGQYKPTNLSHLISLFFPFPLSLSFSFHLTLVYSIFSSEGEMDSPFSRPLVLTRLGQYIMEVKVRK